MINGMYISTMGAMVEASKHGVTANNLANVTTTGFKPDVVNFRQLLPESLMQSDRRMEVDELMEKTGGGAWLNSTSTIYQPGPMISTENPLNVAVRTENGFIEVERDGERYLTRDGNFTFDSTGRLMLGDGKTMVMGGENVALSDNGAIKINEDGTIVSETNGATLGRLSLVRVDDTSKLVKVGNNLFSAKDAVTTQGGVALQGGALENSATDPMAEMVNMIEATRAYQANMKFITIQDQTLGKTVQQVGRVA